MQIIIAGGGKIGAHLASQLCADGETVTVIEQRPDAIERLRRTCPDCTVIEDSAANPARAGARRAAHGGRGGGRHPAKTR